MSRYFVVVPFFNEASWIGATLRALAAQSDRDFVLVCVDNASTDSGADVVRTFAATHPDLDVRLIAEPVKGTGAAADTGFRYSIENAATHVLRTDADCLPRPDWVANIRNAFDSGAEFVAGRILARRDRGYRRIDAVMLPLLVEVATAYAKVFRRGRGYKTGWVLVAGNNLAVTADLYMRSGGFPRSELSQQNEDRILADRARALTSQIVSRPDVVVLNSVRRIRAYGYVNTLLWYWDRKYRPAEVDVR
jgi:glycosyltransferase involved in cell wall biosynthesis